ncbi:DUF4401 domain-containing protein [Sphingobacterium humi]|uniref:DUF4401 domain-containing protein n=1 Tax=Sphingobacterium humi TaxID=1796905 RepID=A0A6N8L4J1_9SPHI|nr:DUF4401 domain-containing protein [Sphingobacterium humi]MVZ63098.1 DUF4401 domain-containing protein [Sphingobacterium humi]
MKLENKVTTLLSGWNAAEEIPGLDNEGLALDLQEQAKQKSLPIKILSIFGGLISSASFVGFLFMVGFFENRSLYLPYSALFLGLAILISLKFKHILLDTICVSCLCVSYILLLFSFEEMRLSGLWSSLLIFILSTLILWIMRNNILTFILTLIICVSFFFFWKELGDFTLAQFFPPLLGILLCGAYLQEGKIIAWRNHWSNRYHAIRSALSFSYLGGLLYFTTTEQAEFMHPLNWVVSLLYMGLIGFVLARVLQILKLENKTLVIAIYLLTFASLAPTIFYPAIAGSLFLILLSFMVNYRTGFVLGLASLIYAVSRFYYDLDYSLLTKSIMLMASGGLFLILYFINRQKAPAHEKN